MSRSISNNYDLTPLYGPCFNVQLKKFFCRHYITRLMKRYNSRMMTFLIRFLLGGLVFVLGIVLGLYYYGLTPGS